MDELIAIIFFRNLAHYVHDFIVNLWRDWG